MRLLSQHDRHGPQAEPLLGQRVMDAGCRLRRATSGYLYVLSG